METAGTTKILSSYKEKHGLCYTSFYGDGDSKAYPAVKDIYGPTKLIKKFECVGYSQKARRLGSSYFEEKHKRTVRKRKTH